jgi:hypothetical protein
MTSIQPLPIYPDIPSGDELRMLKHAKQSLGIQELVKPVRAVPGSPGRIIAIGETPEWIADYVKVSESSFESFKKALMFVLRDAKSDTAKTVLEQLKDIFGEGTREIQ